MSLSKFVSKVSISPSSHVNSELPHCYRLGDESRAPTPKPRPKTTGPRKMDRRSSNRSPKGAWFSEAPSPLVRPLSAGVVNPHPRINVDHVLAEGRFRANDPAIPLIAAIKSEIERVSLPGSTADLRN